jgi:hypothetical protein
MQERRTARACEGASHDSIYCPEIDNTDSCYIQAVIRFLHVKYMSVQMLTMEREVVDRVCDDLVQC